ncbi:2OG-Fe(II) oxygenase family protein [Winogradskyella damuponensis]|uniref:2-oxoglutarate and iron-dependent oxygenase domain-containing protein n=1 Tax=Winogradskyella damuponensis TaxID=943939 RepID=A0ABP8CNR3_9FLAO
MNIMVKTINKFPVIQLEDILSSDELIKESLDLIGCLVIQNSEIDDEKIEFGYNLMSSFFSLDNLTKQKYSFKKIDQKKYSDIGYFPFKTEIAVNQKIPDLKEMFHIGRDFKNSSLYATNFFPSEIQGFETFFTTLFNEFEIIGNKVFQGLTKNLPLKNSYKSELLSNNNSLLRLIHYPPCDNNYEKGMRAAPHTGIQLLGIQPKASSEGLEFYSKKLGWFRFPKLENCIIINIGEMMSYISNKHFQPTLHRVSNASYDKSRQAIVHFFHPNSEIDLVNIENNTSVKSGEWLIKRLKEIGVYK